MIKPSVETDFEDTTTISDIELEDTSTIIPVLYFNPYIKVIYTKFGSYIIQKNKYKDTHHGFRGKQLKRYIERRYKNLRDYIDFVFGKPKDSDGK